MSKRLSNPFYIALLLVGTVFAFTAIAYVVMIVVKMKFPESEHPLVVFMDANGDRMLLIELGLLAVATVAAIGMDDWFEPSGEQSRSREADSPAADARGEES